MRKIAIIVGSKSDLSQCHGGLEFLKEHQNSHPGEIEVVGIYVRSQHRNTLETQELLRELANMEVDVAIIGAGWANHLTGCCDAFLRYTLKNDHLVVIGVAFEDKENERHNQAAYLSITEVPGTQVIFEDDDFPNVGPLGFSRACVFAVDEELPEIKLPAPRPTMDLALEEALEISQN
ncbi:MAG: AIR carboxylase family protein [Candidatus Falkowbacteria bacterium]|nr:MAG: AIR carboxylase family protein [Candidatus Falkowbacteria bacterium]